MSKYQQDARSFCTHHSNNLAYPMFGIYEELGELIEKTPIEYEKSFSGIASRIVLNTLVLFGKALGKWAKRIRKGKTQAPFAFDIYKYNNNGNQSRCKYELGDIHWMLVNLDTHYGFDSSSVEKANITKLTERRNKNEIINHKDH